MTEYLTEQEQIELLKSWVKQYSGVILGGVLIAVIAVTGWRYWQERQAKILTHASAVFDEMIANRGQNNIEGNFVQATKLFTHYPQTTYGQLAALALARDAVNKKDYPAAEIKLNWVIEHSNINSFKQIARIRLARLMLAEKKADESIKLLSTINDNSFVGMIDEVRGDAYVAMKNPTAARDAYKKALTELPNAQMVRPLLQIKFDNLSL